MWSSKLSLIEKKKNKIFQKVKKALITVLHKFGYLECFLSNFMTFGSTLPCGTLDIIITISLKY